MTIRQSALLTAAAAFGLVPAFAAEKYDLDIDNSSVNGAPLEQRAPAIPTEIRRDQEGWVRVNFVISADGRATDPIILDAVGGPEFHSAVHEAVLDWRFEASDQARASNTADIRFVSRGGGDGASRSFQRYQRNILLHLHYEEFDKAREAVNTALAHGGWNLYESTMLWLLVGRVDGAEGNFAGKLEHYRRALTSSDENSLDDNVRRDLLAMVFDLQMELQQYAAARRTLDGLRHDAASAAAVRARREVIDELELLLAGDAPITAIATLFNPCETGACPSLWAYRPVRPSFSFAALNGNVERFEVRCEHDRLQGIVEIDTTWVLPEAADKCQVFVFGDDGASFQFVEHAPADDSDATEPAAVARSNVLD